VSTIARLLVAILMLALLWFFAFGAFWLHAPAVAIGALAGTLALAAVIYSLAVNRFRANFILYSRPAPHWPTEGGVSLIGRLYYGKGKGFGLTRLEATKEGLKVDVWLGLVGTFWFPIAKIRMELARASPDTGFVTGLTWSTLDSATMTFIPWLGDVDKLRVVLGIA
jgi:hypothetical protein